MSVTNKEYTFIDTFYGDVVGGVVDSRLNPIPDPWSNVDSIVTQSAQFFNSVQRIRTVRKVDFKRLIALGLDATTPVSTSSFRVIIEPDEMLVSAYSGTFYRWVGLRGRYIQVANGDISMDDIADHYDRAMLKFLIKCRESQSRFSGFTFLGELKETLELIHSPAKLALKLIDKTTRRTILGLRRYGVRKDKGMKLVGRKAKEAKRFIANQWLQLQFGIAPLLSDIDDGMRALAEFNNYSPRDHVQSTYKFDKSLVTVTSNGYNGFGWKERTVTKLNLEIVTRGSLRLNVEGKVGPSIARHFGFTWGDAALAGWEICPWSFLADYFGNIGDIIAAATFASSDLSWCNRTTRIRKTRDNRILLDSFTRASGDECTVAGGGNALFREITRSVVREFHTPYVPSLKLKCPGIESRKWLNVLALASQL
jgi:hypothetical protein